MFGVHIHILRVECQLQQSHVFFPSTPHQEAPSMDHITMVFGDGEGNPYHAHAVTNRRKLAYKVHWKNAIGLANFCDFCGSCKQSMHQSKAEGLQHMSECMATFMIQHEKGSEVFKRSDYYHRQYKETQSYSFSKDKKNEEYRKCNLCQDTMHKNRLSLHQCTIPLPSNVPEKPIAGGEHTSKHMGL